MKREGFDFYALLPAGCKLCDGRSSHKIANDLLTLIHPNGLAARVAVLGKHAVKTRQTIRPSISHDVSLSPELEIALETRKVFHMPCSAFGLGALVGEYDLKS